ncbi:hypothetical protein OG601_47090 [Streptomyces sp. NBC_01239]|uniref:hypothetical protein n=1 Tax=Streptomyces sp. NBC_01239 TaxID=2903792 RepID=UPI00225AADC5|nr:hypothetical protein [Streptomyces sp. NBC_01239]MCX4809041.1 hypothetical protein [Streptomyces sp. NBC_01239]MCX4818141.1 hypothetical protein [Streptomyces sp. NBC_01239]
MTETPYTDDDLRNEAALCLFALSTSPTVADILRWLPGAYVESHREEDRSGHTWGDLLDNTGLAKAARKIHGLIGEAHNAVGALSIARWLVDLDADGLEPTTHEVTFDNADGPFIRLHLAFHPSMPEHDRQRFHAGIKQALRDAI